MKLFGRLLIFALCVFTLMRWLQAITFFDKPANDFLAYYEVSQSIFNGENPYLVDAPPLASPLHSIFFLPLLSLEASTASVVFRIAVLISAIGLFWLLGTKSEMISGKTSWSSALWLIVFLNCRPVIEVAVHGQLSTIVYLLFFLGWYEKKSWMQAVYFSIATVLKVSLTPLFIILLLFKWEWEVVIKTCCLILVWILLPVLLASHLFDVYHQYISVLPNLLAFGRHDSYGNAGLYNLIYLEFWTDPLANLISKTLFFFGWIAAVYNAPTKYYIPLLLFTSVVTMLLVYHRTYDLPATMVFLIVVTELSRRAKNYGTMIFSSCFLFFFIVPNFLANKWVPMKLAKLPVDGWVHVYNHSFFPLAAICLCLLGLWSAWLALRPPRAPFL